MNAISTELKSEAIRLRVEERCSIKEVSELTGIAKGTLSLLLRPYPLTEEEVMLKIKSAKRYATPKKSHGEESKHHKIIVGKKLKPQQKGNIAEAAVLFRFALHDLEPFASIFDGDKIDFMVRVRESGDIFKIQVKYIARKSQYGLPGIMLTCTEGHGRRRRYQQGEFDFIVGYYLFNDTAYVYSFDEVTKYKTLVTISDEHAERWNKLRG